MTDKNKKNEVKRALDLARSMVEDGDYEGALQKHIWFHNNALLLAPSYRGVRLSFALFDWIELGGKYPRALEELKKIRDAKTAQLLSGDPSVESFIDVTAINDRLNEFRATADLLKLLESKSFVFPSRLDLTGKALLAAKEYALAKRILGDPTKRLEAAKDRLAKGLDSARQASENNFTKEVVIIVSILKESGDLSAATVIKMEALRTLDNDVIRKLLKCKPYLI